MRKGIAAAIVAALVLGISVGAAAVGGRKSIEVDYSGIRLKVDGKLVETGTSQPFVVVDESRTYIPARFLAEAMGAKVGYDAAANLVVVHTPRYVESEQNNGVTTYRFPYYGTSINWPSGGSAETGGTNLLRHQSATAGLVVDRLKHDVEASKFEPFVESMIEGLQMIMPITISRQYGVSVPGAVRAIELRGAMKVANVEMPIWIRLIASDSGVWMLMASTEPASTMDDETITAYLNTFSLGK